ncbi:MAG TPA: EAL domain-containing protein [Casimicrobiaceae bacterium]|nr:EAL domain-containing protein [Casimicrobiaceae bacterium]
MSPGSSPHAGDEAAPDAPLRLLIVEDVTADVELEMYELRRAGVAATCRVVDTEQGMRAAIPEFRPDVIISDFSMPHFDGLAALALARRIVPDVPFVFVSGTVGEEAAIRALHAGASDYVLKANLRRLPSTIERCVKEARLHAERRRTEAALATLQQRLHDVSTSLPDVLWSATLPGERVEFISRACETVYGRPADDFRANPNLWKEMIHPEDRARVAEAWQQMRNGEPFDVEYRIVRADATLAWVNHRGRLVREGEDARFDGIVRDITGAVRDRKHLARLAAIHAWLADTNAAIVRIRRDRELLQEVVRLAARITDIAGATATIFDVDSSPVHFSVRAGVTAHAHDPQNAFAQSVRQSAGSALAVQLAGARRIWNDLADSDVPDRRELIALGIRAVAAFPLAIDGRTVGEIQLFSWQPAFFEPAVAQLLREVAGNLSLALQLLSKQTEADYLALYDPLTGLPNRALLQSRLREFVSAAARSGSRLALVLLSVERMRDVNMLGGQQAGDELLRLLANRLRAIAGDEARVARLAGDHFALVVNDLVDAAALPGMLFGAGPGLLDIRHVVHDREIHVTMRAGVAVYPSDGMDADALFQGAESALEDARMTRTRVAFCSPQLKAAAAERVDIEHAISTALSHDRFVLYYQAKVDLASGRICGVEALLRIADPDEGIIGPQRFIGVLEASRLIDRVGRWVMEEALRAQARWRRRSGASPRVAVNVSAVQLLRAGFVDVVADVLKKGGPEARLEFEITESVAVDDLEASVSVLARLRELGVTIALDDFGTGYSSLRYLSAMPLDAVKIDRAFVAGLPASAGNASISSAILSLASALELTVIAEGVETEEQAQWLRVHGCPIAQGYLFARPEPEERFADAWHADLARNGKFTPGEGHAPGSTRRSR